MLGYATRQPALSRMVAYGVFGLMPHPERFITATQHPAWHGRLDPDAAGSGLAVFVNAVRATA